MSWGTNKDAQIGTAVNLAIIKWATSSGKKSEKNHIDYEYDRHSDAKIVSTNSNNKQETTSGINFLGRRVIGVVAVFIIAFLLIGLLLQNTVADNTRAVKATPGTINFSLSDNSIVVKNDANFKKNVNVFIEGYSLPGVIEKSPYRNDRLYVDLQELKPNETHTILASEFGLRNFDKSNLICIGATYGEAQRQKIVVQPTK